MSVFKLDHFYKFLTAIRVDTKERGTISLAPENLLGTQRFFFEQVAKGLDEGVHHFLALKGRQAGITTAMLALDLYWMFKHKAMTATLVMHDEPTRDMMRSTLQMYYGSLPKTWRQPIVQANRNQFVFKNKSRMLYQIASAKNKGFGRGKAIQYLHGTEAAFWPNSEGIDSLENSFAQTSPNRLYVYETTANGFNYFQEMWETSKRATSSRAIFIPWWLNNLYQFDKFSAQYKTYWDGKLDSAEREWVKDVKRLYKYELTGEQMAWWRWMLNEKTTEEGVLLQEHPPTENYAFQMSGSNFFPTASLNEALQVSKKIKPEHYRLHFGLRFEDTKLVGCGKEIANLRIWHHPVEAKDAFYVIGADPAYGSSDWADQFCLSVWRCYEDGMDQVAEFCTPHITTSNFAWAIAFLGGAYGMSGNCILNLEMNGPGTAVQQELDNMRRTAMATSAQSSKDLYNVMRHMQDFIYRRIDSTSFGSGAKGWITTAGTKERMLNVFKDGFIRQMIRAYSQELIVEMKGVVRDGGSIMAMGRSDKDDRVIAAALAAIAWADRLRIPLLQRHIKRPAAPTGEADPEVIVSPMQKAVSRLLVPMNMRR